MAHGNLLVIWWKVTKMSFIRCLSNPEGLYIIDNIGGYIEVFHSVKPPLASSLSENDPSFKINRREWYGLWSVVKRKHAGWLPDSIKYGNLSLIEEYVETTTGLPTKKSPLEKNSVFKTIDEWFDYKEKVKPESLFKLSNGKDFVYLWRVTICYAGQNVMKRQ